MCRLADWAAAGPDSLPAGREAGRPPQLRCPPWASLSPAGNAQGRGHKLSPQSNLAFPYGDLAEGSGWGRLRQWPNSQQGLSPTSQGCRRCGVALPSLAFQRRLDSSSGELAELEETQEPECQKEKQREQRERESAEKGEGADSPTQGQLFRISRGPAADSPHGEWSCACPHPAPPKSPERTRESRRRKAVQKRRTRKGESAGCRRTWTWP